MFELATDPLAAEGRRCESSNAINMYNIYIYSGARNRCRPLNLLLSFQFLGVRILGSIATRSSQPVGVHGQRRFTATCSQHPLEVHSHLRFTASQAPWSIEVHSHLNSKFKCIANQFLEPTAATLQPSFQQRLAQKTQKQPWQNVRRKLKT